MVSNLFLCNINKIVWKKRKKTRKKTEKDIPYPFPELKGVPIFNSLNKELIYIYIPNTYFEKFISNLKLKENRFYDNDNIDELNDLICQCLDDSFRNCPLTERLTISYNQNMDELKPSFSFILYPEEEFLNTDEVREILGNFRELKKQIMKNQSDNESFLNPFFKEDSDDSYEEDYEGTDDEFDEDYDYEYNEYMDMNIWQIYHKLKTIKTLKCLPKRGVSLMTHTERQILKRNTQNKIFSKKSLSHEHFNIKNNNLNEIKIRRKHKAKYTKMIKELFCEKLNDFRSEIVIYCINNSSVLDNDNFENFVCFLEFFIILFTGIRTKYFIDELTNLNMDFYADENNLMNFAETFRYQVQFRIKDIPLIYDSSKKIYHKRDNKIINNENFNINKFLEINELNNVEFENFNWKQVEYYPPYTNYIKELSASYHRYDTKDRIHICKECENISNLKQCLNLKCKSSCFKSMDKERLIYKGLMTVMSEDSIEDCYIIKDTLLIPNYYALNEKVSTLMLISTFLIPIETKETKKINKIFCNVFGEGIGFFFVWISHYIYWLLFPSLLGLTLHILFVNDKLSDIKNYELIVTLIFTGIIVLWGNYYVISWKKINKFYSHIWGIHDFKMKKEINKDNRITMNRMNFMGIHLPLSSSYKTHFMNIIILILSGLIKVFVMASNIIILAFKNHVFELKKISYNKFLNKYWKYITPIIIYILREIFSILCEKANRFLYSQQKFTSENEKEKMLVRKQLIFEFFNYYFNLYYIAFIKANFEKCLYDDCYKELEQQLITIVISDVVVTCFKFYINVISLRKQKNKFEKEIQSKYLYLENSSKKFRYYTRQPFEDSSIVQYYLQVFLSFGYIIQFGACCPISFILVLFSTVVTRITLGMSLKDIYFAQTHSQSTGLIIINQAQELISFIGIISNLFIIFYTNDSFVNIKTSNKFFYMVLTENIIIFITQFIEPFKLPNWFNYRNKIAIKYYRKYGTKKKKIKQEW